MNQIGRFLVKVPEKLIKKANESNLLVPLEFFYKLKSIKREGYFIDIKDIQKNIGFSSSACYKRINELINLKWIKKGIFGYSLIKYDDLFKYFDYDMTLKFSKRGIRKGKFKIFKISVTQFIKNIAFEEAKLNLSRQSYIVRKKILIQKLTLDSAKIKINHDITLSVRGICRILGFKSSSKGFKILQELEQSKLISVVRRPILYDWSLPNLISIN